MRRPAPRPSAGPGPEAPERPARPARLARLVSVRGLVFTVVVLVGFTLLFPTVRAYLSQRAELEGLAAEVEAAEARERDLEAELRRWDDPAFVQAQARSRLSFVFPGQTAFRVIDPEVVPDEDPLEPLPSGAGPHLPDGEDGGPWYATVWESVRLAGEVDSVLEQEASPSGAGDEEGS
ncbi:septum formation initiator family protein [Cellulomonas bogoriensis]